MRSIGVAVRRRIVDTPSASQRIDAGARQREIALVVTRCAIDARRCGLDEGDAQTATVQRDRQARPDQTAADDHHIEHFVELFAHVGMIPAPPNALDHATSRPAPRHPAHSAKMSPAQSGTKIMTATPQPRSTNASLLILGLLALVMAATRINHFAIFPDASWAVFFVAGFYLNRWIALGISVADGDGCPDRLLRDQCTGFELLESLLRFGRVLVPDPGVFGLWFGGSLARPDSSPASACARWTSRRERCSLPSACAT